MDRIGLILAIAVLLSAHLGYTGEAPYREPTEGITHLRSAPIASEQQPFSQKQTDSNAMGLVVSNFGVFGNNLVRRAPSMGYPQTCCHRGLKLGSALPIQLSEGRMDPVVARLTTRM